MPKRQGAKASAQSRGRSSLPIWALDTSVIIDILKRDLDPEYLYSVRTGNRLIIRNYKVPSGGLSCGFAVIF
ncbi:MAG: hypothetical protein AABX47_08895, partial [Nanoarchaeota archaeon]